MASIVVTFFLAVPFPLSPFGFHRLVAAPWKVATLHRALDALETLDFEWDMSKSDSKDTRNRWLHFHACRGGGWEGEGFT